MRMSGKQVILLLGLFSLVLVSLSLQRPIGGIRINRSPSLSHRVFFGSRFGTKERSGGLVSFRHTSCVLPMAKRIIAKAGDFIEVRRGVVLVNGHTLPFRTRSSSGQSYSPIQVGEVPKGHVFVVGDHPDSFDSRYEQFGCIPIEDLEECLWPIF